MTRADAIANLKMISVAFVEPVTQEQRTLIDDTFDMAINALEQEPKAITTSTDEPMVMHYPQVDGITPTVVKIEQESKTGHWIKSNPLMLSECSECGNKAFGYHGFDEVLTDFCPNCGADMRGGVNDK